MLTCMQASLEHLSSVADYLKVQTMLPQVVAPCSGVDNKVPQLYATQSEPLD